MNPEWSKRAGLVLASKYWEAKGDTDEDYDNRWSLIEREFDPLKDAMQEADSYDDLDDAMKSIFDRAEKAAKEWEEFAQNDTDGYGRFLGTYP